MQYLPIYPEKSWLETVAYDEPTKQVAYKWDWWENLPLTYYLGNQIVEHYNSWNPAFQYGMVPLETVALPFVWLTDALWTMWNTTYNGYKRLYNYWANAYNNLADRYNNWQMQRQIEAPVQVAPQTSLTWRKITWGINLPTLPQQVKPTRYLVGANGQIVAKIVD